MHTLLLPHVACAQQGMAERARLVWEALEPLMDTDANAEQFAPFDFV